MSNEEYSWFKFNLNGPVDIVYKLLRLRMEKSKYSVQSASGGFIVDIELIAEFSPDTAQKLSTYFPAIKAGMPDGYLTYRFVMKEEIVKRHNKEFYEALMPEDLLAAANSACIRLENFECRGYGKLG